MPAELTHAEFKARAEAGRVLVEELLHAKTYDPIKAREYYLRTRQLKGRNSGGEDRQSGNGQPQLKSAPAGSSRKQELEAQKAALNKRLDRLRAVLEERVAAAKARSGVEKKPDAKSSPDSKESASKPESKKKDSPLSEKQKRDKADAAREKYEKENGKGGDSSLAQDVERLQRQIKDIQSRIKDAIEDARKKASSSSAQIQASPQFQNQTASKGR